MPSPPYIEGGTGVGRRHSKFDNNFMFAQTHTREILLKIEGYTLEKQKKNVLKDKRNISPRIWMAKCHRPQLEFCATKKESIMRRSLKINSNVFWIWWSWWEWKWRRTSYYGMKWVNSHVVAEESSSHQLNETTIVVRFQNDRLQLRSRLSDSGVTTTLKSEK